MAVTSQRYRRLVASRIAAVSLLVAALVSPLAWYISTENLEAEVVGLAVEESRRLVMQIDAEHGGTPLHLWASQAAKLLTGGLFDIVEIYDSNGQRLAEHATGRGHSVEGLLSLHVRPESIQPQYESIRLPDGRWVLRVFAPLWHKPESATSGLIGYIEGVRIVPDWQRDQLRRDALGAAALAALAAILCGAVIFPIVLQLSQENDKKAQQVLASHVAMMEALGRAIAKRDSDTGAHNYRVAWIAARLGETLGLSDEAMRTLNRQLFARCRKNWNTGSHPAQARQAR